MTYEIFQISCQCFLLQVLMAETVNKPLSSLISIAMLSELLLASDHCNFLRNLCCLNYLVHGNQKMAQCLNRALGRDSFLIRHLLLWLNLASDFLPSLKPENKLAHAALWVSYIFSSIR